MKDNVGGFVLPVTAGQEAMWLINQLSPGRNFYNVHFVWDISEGVDLILLQRCLECLHRHHEAWRTIYPLVNGVVSRKIDSRASLNFEIETLESDAEELLTQRLDYDFLSACDLKQCVPLMWKVYLRPGKPPVLAWFQHHIGIDLWSAALIATQLRDLYSKALRNEPLQIPETDARFDDFISEQKALIASEKGELQKAFCLSHLVNFEPGGHLQGDKKKSNAWDYESAYQPFELDAEAEGRFIKLCRKHRVMPFNGFLALFHLLLHRLSGDEDIVVCTPTAGRNSRYTGLCNYFVNPVMVRLRYDTDMDFDVFLQGANGHIKQVLRNRDYPLALLSRHISKYGQSGPANLCSASFAWEDVNAFEKSSTPLVSWQSLTERNWDMGEMGVWRRHLRKTQIDEFDLNFKIYRFNDRLYGGIEYNAAVFKAETIATIGQCFNALLSAVSLSPDQSVHSFALLSPAQMMQQIVVWNKTRVDYDHDLTLHKQLEHFAKNKADSSALVFGESVLSYQKLNERANQLAHFLIRHGVSQGCIVGIALPRSMDAYVALLAVLKTGAAYLPIDPGYPVDRQKYMLQDSGASFLLTDRITLAELQDIENILLLDELESVIATMPVSSPENAISPNQLAYVIYTSGSTGNPKGVMIPHSGYAHLMCTQREVFQLQSNDRVLQFASLSFDASVYAMALAWGVGATLVAAAAEKLVGIALTETIEKQRVSTAVLPPSILNGCDEHNVRGLKTLIVAGEPCSQTLAERWSQGRRLYNAYGPTESTVWATCAQIDGSETPTIGRPVANTQVYILDKYLNPVPAGISGELHIGGDGLALGYLNRPDLTAERFIPNPLPGTPGERLYKTGDLARYRPDGQIEFLGRIDHQLKIRGFRIEPGEIEAACLTHAAVQEALVVGIEQADSMQLVAYLVPHPQAERNEKMINERIIKEHLRAMLPDYMVPVFVVALDAFPLTPNDKIDRRALPAPVIDVSQAADDLVAGTVEQVIADVWSEVLSIERVPLKKNFFDLGGHSLKVAQVYDKLPDDLRRQLSLLDLYQYPTVASLAAHLRAAQTPEKSASIANEATPDSGDRHQDIAIIATALRVPGAQTPEQFWRNLCDGVEGITFFSDEQLLRAGVPPELLEKPWYVKAKGMLENIRMFDAEFFDMTPREAQITDPQQRHFLECAWEALERAGYVGELETGSVGVYAGVGKNRYYEHHIASHPELETTVGDMPIALGNNADFLATRVAYKLNLQGPAITVQTACSTSLVAVHIAVQALLRGDCAMALAGGVSLGNLQQSGYLHMVGMIGSPDGHTRTFDEQAAGTVASQGAGVVLLKPLDKAKADGDQIIAVIKGTAINNDGADKAGFTAPSINGQSAVIRKALAQANIGADSIGYVEAHGTATALGDPIEVAALTQAYRMETQTRQYCAIGSVKSNLGHLDSAAGITGLIKAAMVVQQGQIPPTLHFHLPNPAIPFAQSPFFVNDTLRPFPNENGVRRAAVSAFGLGGTNAHAIVEAHEETLSEGACATAKNDSSQLFVLSAHTADAILELSARLRQQLQVNDQLFLEDVAHTLRVGRKRFACRVAFVAQSLNMAIEQLESVSALDAIHVENEDKTPVFLFPGQGVNYREMGKALYEKDERFKADIDHAHDLLKATAIRRGINFSEEDLRAETDRLQCVELAHPLLFILEYAIARQLQRMDIVPTAMLGHSAGEWVPATLAGVFTLEQAIELMLTRGQLIQTLPEGGMLALAVSVSEAGQWVERFPELSIAAINATDQCVISGPVDVIASLELSLSFELLSTEQQCDFRRLSIQCAGHSQMLDAILDDFRQQLNQFSLSKPSIPFISNLTGNWITDEQAIDPEYWVAHLRQPVQFAKGVATLLNSGYRDFVEVGPGSVLSALVRRNALDMDVQVNTTAMLNRQQHPSEAAAWWQGLGDLWLQGYPLRWSAIESPHARRVELPTYPFQRQEHWIESKRSYVDFTLFDNDGQGVEPKRFNRRVTDRLPRFHRRAEDPLPPDSVVESDKALNADLAVHDQVLDQQNSQQDAPVLNKVIALWKSMLGVVQIKPSDNYFKLGGDSLLAVRMLAQLSEAFGIQLSPKALLVYPTATALAEHIHSLFDVQEKERAAVDADLPVAEQEQESDSVLVEPTDQRSPLVSQGQNLVCMQAGDSSNTALVLVHAVGGDVYYYQDLCHKLPEQLPVYAIQSPGLDDGGQAFDCVTTMASAYLAELEQGLAGMNFILGGSSFGGLVALEMARQYEVKNQIKTPLVMIDTPTPYAIRPYAMFRSIDVLDYLLRNVIGATVAINVEALAELSLDQQIDQVAGVCADKGVILPPQFTRNMINTWLVHQQALVDYRVPDYDGSVLYLRHGEPMPNFPRMLHQDWLRYLQGDFTVKCIAGNHITMNLGNNAGHLAREISAFIGQVNVDLVLDRVKHKPLLYLVS